VKVKIWKCIGSSRGRSAQAAVAVSVFGSTKVGLMY
jgi:hypothetical protein